MSDSTYNSLSRTVLQGNILGVRGAEAPDGMREDNSAPPWPMPMYSDAVEGNDFAGIYRRTAMQRRWGGGPVEAALATYEPVSGFGGYMSRRGFRGFGNVCSPFDDDFDASACAGLVTGGGGSTPGPMTVGGGGLPVVGGGQNPDNCPNMPGYDPNGMSGGACNVPITPGSAPTPEQNCRISGGTWNNGQCGCPTGFVSGGNPPSCFAKAVAEIWKKGGTWQPPPPVGGTVKAVPKPSANVPPSGAPPKQAGILANPLLWVGLAVAAGGGFLLYEHSKKKKAAQMRANRKRRSRLWAAVTITTEAAVTTAVTTAAAVAGGVVDQDGTAADGRRTGMAAGVRPSSSRKRKLRRSSTGSTRATLATSSSA
jgi:hypothetical protein